MLKFLGLLFFLICAAFPVFAEDGRFNVNVSVDVTDKSAAIARERAMNEANRAAFSRVAQKITDSASAAKLAALPANQLINFIREVSVLEEKSSPVRYIATLRVAVNDTLLKAYMQEQNMPFLLQTAIRIMIVPVWQPQNGEYPRLWETDNPWYQAWRGGYAEGGVTFVPVPQNAVNIAELDAEKALALDASALDKIYRANGVDDVYVIAATPKSNGLLLKLHSYKNGSNAFESLSVSADGARMFSAAVSAAAEKIAGRSRNQEVMQNQEEHEITVLYDYDSLADMVTTETRLKDIAYITNLTAEAVAYKRAQYRMTYMGSIDKLITALQDKHFILQDYDNFFVLHKI